jgi:DNA-binding response OmpR family regulator
VETVPDSRPRLLIVHGRDEEATWVHMPWSMNVTLSAVSSVEAAFGLIGIHHFACVVLDLDAVGDEGLWLVRHLCTEVEGTAYARPKVACLSHDASLPRKLAAICAGADDYLLKSLDKDLFWLKIALLVRSHQLLLP